MQRSCHQGRALDQLLDRQHLGFSNLSLKFGRQIVAPKVQMQSYYGAGGAMDKRLLKVEVDVERCCNASALVLVDGVCVCACARAYVCA